MRYEGKNLKDQEAERENESFVWWFVSILLS